MDDPSTLMPTLPPTPLRTPTPDPVAFAEPAVHFDLTAGDLSEHDDDFGLQPAVALDMDAGSAEPERDAMESAAASSSSPHTRQLRRMPSMHEAFHTESRQYALAEMLVAQTGCTRERAARALEQSSDDVADALLLLMESD